MDHPIFRPPESIRSDTELTVVLVDFSNLLYRAWFVSREEPWIAYCKFFDMLRLCIRKSKQPGVPIGVIFADEGKTRLKRSEIYPDYKAQRTHPKNPKFAEYRMLLRNMINKLGWNMISIDGAEADDVIASIIAQNCHRCFCKKKCDNCDCASKYKKDFVIFSGDKDLQQLLAWDRVLIYRAPGVFVNRAGFEEEYGIPATKYGIYKALIGDSSDNIKGVIGFGPAKAKVAINKNTVAEDVWELGGREAADQFIFAYKLVTLDTHLNIDIEGIYIGPPRIEKLTNIDHRVRFEIQRLKEELK